MVGSTSLHDRSQTPLVARGRGRDEESPVELLRRVGLGERTRHYPNQLSSGEQQRVAVARAFASSAKVLFADEPTGSLDTETGHALSELLFNLNREFGTTLVLVTHDADLAGRCGRVVQIKEGRLVDG